MRDKPEWRIRDDRQPNPPAAQRDQSQGDSRGSVPRIPPAGVCLFPLTLLLLAGCVSSQMMAVGPKTYPPRPENYVIEVFCTEEAPINIQQQIANIKSSRDIALGALTIGRVDSSGAPASSWGAVVGDAMGKARSLGGDGLVVNRWDQTLTGVGSYGETYYRKNLSFSVIRYRP